MKTHIHLQICVKEYVDYRSPSEVGVQPVWFEWIAVWMWIVLGAMFDCAVKLLQE